MCVCVWGGGGGAHFANISGYYLLHGDVAFVVNDLRFQARQLHPHLKEADITLGIRFSIFTRISGALGGEGGGVGWRGGGVEGGHHGGYATCWKG